MIWWPLALWCGTVWSGTGRSEKIFKYDLLISTLRFHALYEYSFATTLPISPIPGCFCFKWGHRSLWVFTVIDGSGDYAVITFLHYHARDLKHQHSQRINKKGTGTTDWQLTSVFWLLFYFLAFLHRSRYVSG